MAEVWPKFKAIGMENVGIAPTFRQVYSSDEVYGSYTISSSDMNLIAPPNADFRICGVMLHNSSIYNRFGRVNDIGISVGGGGTVRFDEITTDTTFNIFGKTNSFNYVSVYSENGDVKTKFWYYFNTSLVDYARAGKWSTDNIAMTDGYPFNYVDFSTSSTSYTTLLQTEYENVIKVKKAGFWLGLWVSAADLTGYAKCEISNDGQSWTTLWEASTSYTTETAVKTIAYNIQFKFIRYQAKTTGGTVYLRVRELHYWGERSG